MRDEKKPKGQHIPTVLPPHHISFDLEAFDNLILSQGVKVRHKKAMPDPRALIDEGTNNRTNLMPNSDGFIYKDAGVFIAYFNSNDKLPEYVSEGQLDHSQAIMTPPRFYLDQPNKRVIINVFDRLEIEDVELFVSAIELITTNKTGIDRLNWPAIDVEYLDGADGFEYKKNVHFQITPCGDIKWISQKRPSFNISTGKGEVYSIRYIYKPFFVVRRLLHEIRVAQVTDPNDGTRFVERMPYQVQVARENVFRDKMKTGKDLGDLMPHLSPAHGLIWTSSDSDT
jgi:hypothetical protein